MALARAVLAAGQTDLDIPSLVQLLKTNKSKLYYGMMACHLADILFHLGKTHFEKAESWLQEAILNHEQRGMKWDLARDWMVFAEFLKLQGRSEEEKDYLTKALRLFSQCGAEGWCRKIETGCTQE